MADREAAIRKLEEALSDPAQADKHDRIRAALAKARPKGGPPEVAARRIGLAEQQARTHTPDEGGQQLDYIPGPAPQESFKERVNAMGRGVKALGTAVRHPVDTLSSPEKTRQLTRGASDVFFGLPVAAADALHENLPAGMGATGGRPFAETAKRDAEVAPDFRTAGAIPAMLAPNPAGLIFRGAGAVAGKAFGRVPVGSAVSGAPMGAAKSLVSYEATAPFAAAIHPENAGRRLEAAREAAVDPLGLILSGSLGAAGGAGRGNAARIRNPNTQSGQVIRDVEAGGGKIKKFGTNPVEGGVFETDELRNLPEGRRGTHALADKSVSRIESANQARLKAARQQFGDTVDDVIASHGDRPHPTTNTHTALDRMASENTINGVIGDEGVAAAVDKTRRMLTQAGGVDEQATISNVMRKMGISQGRQLPPHVMRSIMSQAGPEDIVPQRLQQVSAGDMVKARKLVRQLANNAPTPSENRVYQVVLGAMDEDAAAIDPRIREMNANFSKAMEPIEGANEFLFNKADARLEPSPAQREAAIGRLGQIGDDTQVGTKRDPALQRFEQQGPEYAREALLMRSKKAQERLRRGDPQTSDAIDKTLQRGPGYAGRAIGTLLGGPVGFAAGLAVDKYRQNPLANKVRLGLPASEAVGKLSGRSAVGVDQITGLARERGKKKRKNKEEMPSP